jgi:hypothetical protein
MLVPGTIKASTFIGQGRIRLTLLAYFLAIVVSILAIGHLDTAGDIVKSINSRIEVTYSALFTFLTVFWAAVLTIWSLLKSRATRYIERLSDNVVFQQFISDMEIRLMMTFLVIIFSFIIYIVSPAISAPYDNATVLVAVWAFTYGSAIFLLFDSLLNARIVLA